tara:strand:+ start:1504 stop:2208 length:705 start_codon:yes stop_codon:yes gene_type:complete
MKFTTAVSSLFLAGLSVAQTTPSGFMPATNVTLDVYYGTQYISPGLVVKKSSTPIFYHRARKHNLLMEHSHANSPRNRPHQRHLERKIPPCHDRYLIPFPKHHPHTNHPKDIDGSQNGRTTTVLHALLQDYTLPSPATIQNGTTVLKTTATTPSSYFGPAPPAGQPPTHRYVFLLHEQPANFAVPAAHKQAVSSRFAIDWPKFIVDAGLKAPVAGNYLQVKSGDNTKREVVWDA